MTTHSAASDHAVYLTLKSGNGKVGPIPVSTISRDSCPTACPLYSGGCYALGGPLGIIWSALSKHAPGATWHNSQGAAFTSHTWDSYCKAITALPAGQPWRHGQAGDLPGKGNRIATSKLRALVRANASKRGWTYTHKPVLTSARNAHAVAHANANGFTINLSANGISEVDALVALNIGPVVTILPESIHGKTDIVTANGTRVVVCPATFEPGDPGYKGPVRCVDCMLCARADRSVAVGFPAHGASRRKASTIASASPRVAITRSRAA